MTCARPGGCQQPLGCAGIESCWWERRKDRKPAPSRYWEAQAPARLISRLRSRDPRYLERIEPGFWKMRLVRGGPEIPACIRWIHTTHEPGEPNNAMERSPFLAAFIAGEPVELLRVWDWRSDPITEADHNFRVAEAEWARAGAHTYARSEPLANPRKPVDWLTCNLKRRTG